MIFDPENIEEFVLHLTEIGLTENESKVYYVVFMLKSASVRDIYELSGVPRCKIYAELESLETKGMVSKNNTRPIRYSANDIEQTFAALQKESNEKLHRTEDYLKRISSHGIKNKHQQIYDLQTQWAVDSHLKPIIRRTKKELLLFVSDSTYLKKVLPDTELKRLAKKIDLYIIVTSPDLAKDIPLRCYQFSPALMEKLLETQESSPLPLNSNQISLISDRKNCIGIELHEGEIYGTVVYLGEYFIMSMLFESIVRYLQPVL